MSRQNIYDDETFFAGYQSLRAKPASANVLVEKPALFSLLPSLQDKAVLDLGCGYGENCAEMIRLGAREVWGIDISKRMLEVGASEHRSPSIRYLNLAIEDIGSIDTCFDVVVSSLAVHYVEDFDALTQSVFRLLVPGGCFVFSQENPLNTCFSDGERWTRDGADRAIHANISNYSVDGRRESTWFVDRVVKYHRTFSSIVNSLVEAGFRIQRLIEPIAAPDVVERHP